MEIKGRRSDRIPFVPAKWEGGDGERGRQPNPGRGHLPRKGKRRSKVRSMLEMSTPARTRIWKLSYNSGGSRFRI